MRPAVERKGQAPRSLLTRGEQQTIPAKVVEADPVGAQSIEQGFEARLAEQLAWQQVMPLQRRIVLGRAASVNGPEWKVATIGTQGGWQAIIHPAVRLEKS